jgi:heme-degrading monooxygenase HmoA
MYGTVARIRAKPGSAEMLMEISKQLDEERPPGFVASYVYQMENNPNEYYLAVAFESKDAYWDNARSEEQDKRYRRLREHMQDDPEWHDGEIVYSQTS